MGPSICTLFPSEGLGHPVAPIAELGDKGAKVFGTRQDTPVCAILLQQLDKASGGPAREG